MRKKAPPTAKRRKGVRKKKLGLYARTVLRITEVRDRIYSYKTRALVGLGMFLTLSLYVAWTAGVGQWLSDEIDDAARTALVATGLSIEQVRVEGRSRADLEKVRLAIGVIQGESILHYDIEAARVRLEAMEWVDDAKVIRFLPKTIHIVIRERSPVAIWQKDGMLRLVDRSGLVINEFKDSWAKDLPLVVGTGAPAHAAALLDALAAHPDLNDNLDAAIRVSDRRWNVRLKNGVEIRLPAENISLALTRVVKYDSEYDLLRQEIRSIDMRLPDRVYLRLTNEEADRLWSPKKRT